MAQQKVQDLLDYVYRYCSDFMTQDEQLAKSYQFYIPASGNMAEITDLHRKAYERQFPFPNPDALKLLEQGFQAFKNRVAERILQEHGPQVHINRCPKCGGICRTPQAKQCRFCLHDWH